MKKINQIRQKELAPSKLFAGLFKKGKSGLFSGKKTDLSPEVFVLYARNMAWVFEQVSGRSVVDGCVPRPSQSPWRARRKGSEARKASSVF